MSTIVSLTDENPLTLLARKHCRPLAWAPATVAPGWVAQLPREARTRTSVADFIMALLLAEFGDSRGRSRFGLSVSQWTRRGNQQARGRWSEPRYRALCT